jgi:hypothetical protein
MKEDEVMDSLVHVNESMKLRAPDGSRPRFTLHDLAEATGKSEHEIYRILRAIGCPKNFDHGHTYGWQVLDFPAIVRRVRHFGIENFNDVA